jgi:serine phosphatase RsbU (regulator of sigma subunit)
MRCAYSWATRPAAAGVAAPRDAPAGTPVGAGGDIACAVTAPDAVRLLIGDVMGHDPRAARTAVAVTRAFRRLAASPDPLPVLAARLHDFVAGLAVDLGGEVFVTAQFIAIPVAAAGRPQIVCCGHPPPLLLRAGQVTALDARPPSPPLGLLDLGGYPPRADPLGARPGDCVLLYTDGVSEARDSRGRPYPLAERAAALSEPSAAPGHQGDDGTRLPELLADDVLSHVGGRLHDDATLLCLRFAADKSLTTREQAVVLQVR